MGISERRIERKLSRARQAVQRRDFAAAVQACRDVLSRDAVCLPALNLGAVAAFQGGDAGLAVELLERAIVAHPGDGEAYYNLGTICQARGDTEQAANRFARSAACDPGFAGAHYNHATALLELGRAEDAAAAYRRCIELQPDYAPAYSGLGFVLRGLRRFEDAVQAYRDGLARNPRDGQAQSGLGIALQALDRLPEAQRAFERAVAIDPDDPDATVNLADLLVARGEAREALAACDRYLARFPGDAGVLASKTIALGECGDANGRDALVDFDRFLAATRPAPPPGYDGIESFCGALSDHIVNHPTLIEAPTSHATRDGKHTGELLTDDVAPIRGFEAMVRGAVAEFVDRHKAVMPPHLDPPARYRLTAWSIVLAGQGYQAAHIHPSAWLSGVFYARVPDFIRADDAAHAGWIEFGQPAAEYHATVAPPVRAVRPQTGLLVLFPSYFFHRTIPFTASGTRISVAFDVLPAV